MAPDGRQAITLIRYAPLTGAMCRELTLMDRKLSYNDICFASVILKPNACGLFA